MNTSFTHQYNMYAEGVWHKMTPVSQFPVFISGKDYVDSFTQWGMCNFGIISLSLLNFLYYTQCSRHKDQIHICPVIHLNIKYRSIKICIYHVYLTHWGRDKMVAIFQTTFTNAFSWMKIYGFRLRFHWRLFLRVQLTIIQHWFR